MIEVRLIQQEGPEHYRTWFFEGLDGKRLMAGLFTERRFATIEAGRRGWSIVEYRPYVRASVKPAEPDARMRLLSPEESR